MKFEPKPHQADAIAQVHWDSWVATYTGVFPQASFDAFPLGTRRETWRRETAQADPARRLFVAVQQAEVLGFASLGPYRAQAHEAAPEHLVDAYGIARRNYYYAIGDRRPQSRKYARRRDGGKGGWIVRAEEFMTARFHLTRAQHDARVAKWQ